MWSSKITAASCSAPNSLMNWLASRMPTLCLILRLIFVFIVVIEESSSAQNMKSCLMREARTHPKGRPRTNIRNGHQKERDLQEEDHPPLRYRRSRCGCMVAPQPHAQGSSRGLDDQPWPHTGASRFGAAKSEQQSSQRWLPAPQLQRAGRCCPHQVPPPIS